METFFDYRYGFTHGREDGGREGGTHLSNAMAHLRARNPDTWNSVSDEYKRGYEDGWKFARGG